MSVKLNELKKHLHHGEVYRRADLKKLSNAVDRHLRLLQEEGGLTKLSTGIYYCPTETSFGSAPAEDYKLVKAFLKDHRFLLTSPNAYNVLGLGTTQLYNETIVYNHKRHGKFNLGGRIFDFRVKPYFPDRLTKEFLMIDLVNNLERLAENTEKLLENIRQKTATMNIELLVLMAREYGGVKAKNFFNSVASEFKNQYVT